MFHLELPTSLIYFLIPFLFFFIANWRSIFTRISPSKSNMIPRSYPFIGSFLSFYVNQDRLVLWTSEFVRNSPTFTFILHLPLGRLQVFTANPSNIEHILKTHFPIYQKGDVWKTTFADLLGNGIFNSDGEDWKFQRQVASYEFTTKSLRKFVETVVDTELSNRLLPILSVAAVNKTVLDFQDILQRFALDNICSIAFGYDPATLLPSLPQVKFAQALEDVVDLASQRLNSFHPLLWKAKRFLKIGSEKQLQMALNEIQEHAKKIIKEKKQKLNEIPSLDSFDLLSRLLGSGHLDEAFVKDMIISFLLAGRDTTSLALSWFFWLLSKHPDVEREILKEINEKSEALIFEDVKDMVYTHAALSESMRLYPPVLTNPRQAVEDDVLPDGTVIKKGTRVTYHPYAMARLEMLWGTDCAKFRPERWLEKDAANQKWHFVRRDIYTYPVFHAGPRTCLGKDMAFLQMKRVVAGVLRKFQVVPIEKENEEPVFMSYVSSKMKGGLPVRIEERT